MIFIISQTLWGPRPSLSLFLLHPSLHSAQVVDHLKAAFFLTLDNMQLQATDMVEQLVVVVSASVAALQASQLGRTANASLDEILTRLEEVMARYMPLPLTLSKCACVCVFVCSCASLHGLWDLMNVKCVSSVLRRVESVFVCMCMCMGVSVCVC